jgi:ribosome-associated heat shock protein Hsp15
MNGAAGERCRVDVWLWRARLFKTRALAAAAVSAGGVRLARGGQSRAIDKPGYALSVGDGLSVRHGGRLITLEVLAFGARRGPTAEARALYRRLDEDIDPEEPDPPPSCASDDADP